MVRVQTICIFVFLIGLSLAVERLAIERPVNPTRWALQSKVEDDKPIKLIFAVKQQNVELLEKSLLQIANPKHSRYGQHLTRVQVNAIVAPNLQSIDRITNWIQEQIQDDIIEMEILSDWITLVIPASRAKDLIECTFHRYTHNQSKQITLARCIEGTYTVPSHIAPLLDFIGGTIHFPKISHKTVTSSKLGATPSSLRSLYNVGDTVGQSPNNTQAVAQFLGQYYDPADLKEFFTLFFWPDITSSVEKVVGDNYWYDPGVEASLDIEYIMAMGANIPTWFYSTAGEHENQEPFLEWALLVGNETDDVVPKVISVSYGDDEDSIDYAYADRVSNEFAKMGSRGISVLFASGDSGVGCNDAGNQFVPNFPASSPWVTAVGGTALSWDNSTEETNSLSGGGFSNFFGVPDYQVNAIKTYFQRAKDLPASSFYNISGRAYPDVSALSSDFTVVIDLVPMPGVAGTSCAAPTYSGIVALLNDIRLQNNKPTLGFLNILLYQLLEENPSGFNDITSGCNPGCFANDGFCATVGWDPSSGVGSPNYAGLAKIVRALP